MKNNRTLAIYEASRAFMVAAGQDPLEPVGTFLVRSKSRRGASYEMVHTPEGYAVHQGEGCEGEAFNGPIACWHSKDFTVSVEEIEDMTQAVTTYEGAGALAEARKFNTEDIATLKQTICKGASDAELNLFVATCQHTGLDPFMKQIHAVMRNTKDGDRWVKTMTIQIGIDGYRLIAERTGRMEGLDGPQWTYDGRTWEDLPRDDIPPVAARAGVWRKGVMRPFVAVCRWAAYAQYQGNGQNLTAMWQRMGPEMLAKCAEALALRRAFPAEMASLPARPDFDDDPDVQLEEQFAPALDAIEGEFSAREDPAATEGVGNNAEPPASPAKSRLPDTSGKQATGQPAAECDHDWKFDEPWTLVICQKCKAVEDESAPSGQPALMR